MAKESMDQFAKRRGRESEAKMKARDASSAPTKGKRGKDSADSKGPGPNDWTKGVRGKSKAGC